MGNAPASTALVTGATSGLGFETAAQLAERGFSRVIVTGRTPSKISAAVVRLEHRTGKGVFDPLVLDLDEFESVEAAATSLAGTGRLDRVILNAGIAPTREVLKTADGLETTATSSLIGHHALVMHLLEQGLLAGDASIVIAGSEAARGDVPTFKLVDLRAMADDHFDGDLEKAIETQIRMDAPASHNPADTYAMVKVFVAWWAAAMARKLPEGMKVNAVSPGSTPDTEMINKAPFFMRRIMVPILRLLPGMSHSVADGAARYLEVAEYPESGKFYASRLKKMTGHLAEIDLDHIRDAEGQRALWNVASRVAGGVGYRAA